MEHGSTEFDYPRVPPFPLQSEKFRNATCFDVKQTVTVSFMTSPTSPAMRCTPTSPAVSPTDFGSEDSDESGGVPTFLEERDSPDTKRRRREMLGAIEASSFVCGATATNDVGDLKTTSENVVDKEPLVGKQDEKPDEEVNEVPGGSDRKQDEKPDEEVNEVPGGSDRKQDEKPDEEVNEVPRGPDVVPVLEASGTEPTLASTAESTEPPTMASSSRPMPSSRPTTRPTAPTYSRRPTPRPTARTSPRWPTPRPTAPARPTPRPMPNGSAPVGVSHAGLGAVHVGGSFDRHGSAVAFAFGSGSTTNPKLEPTNDFEMRVRIQRDKKNKRNADRRLRREAERAAER